MYFHMLYLFFEAGLKENTNILLCSFFLYLTNILIKVGLKNENTESLSLFICFNCRSDVSLFFTPIKSIRPIRLCLSEFF